MCPETNISYSFRLPCKYLTETSCMVNGLQHFLIITTPHQIYKRQDCSFIGIGLLNFYRILFWYGLLSKGSHGVLQLRRSCALRRFLVTMATENQFINRRSGLQTSLVSRMILKSQMFLNILNLCMLQSCPDVIGFEESQ